MSVRKGALGQNSLHRSLGTPQWRGQAPHRGGGILPNEAAPAWSARSYRENDKSSVQRARYMTLETIAPLRDDPRRDRRSISILATVAPRRSCGSCRRVRRSRHVSAVCRDCRAATCAAPPNSPAAAAQQPQDPVHTRLPERPHLPLSLDREGSPPLVRFFLRFHHLLKWRGMRSRLGCAASPKRCHAASMVGATPIRPVRGMGTQWRQ